MALSLEPTTTTKRGPGRPRKESVVMPIRENLRSRFDAWLNDPTAESTLHGLFSSMIDYELRARLMSEVPDEGYVVRINPK